MSEPTNERTQNQARLSFAERRGGGRSQIGDAIQEPTNEPTNEVRGETKLAWAMPYEKEEDFSQNKQP